MPAARAMASSRRTGRPSISAAGGNSAFCPSNQGSDRAHAFSARTIRSPETVKRKSSHTHPQPVQAKFSTTRSERSHSRAVDDRDIDSKDRARTEPASNRMFLSAYRFKRYRVIQAADAFIDTANAR